MLSFPRGCPGVLVLDTTNVWWDAAGVNGLRKFSGRKSLRFAMLARGIEGFAEFLGSLRDCGSGTI
jgi:hypothetical protein